MNTQYIAVKAKKAGQISWLDAADESALQRFRAAQANTDLLVSTWRSTEPHPSAPRNYSLCFHIGPGRLENVRTHAPQACYYLAEYCCIPQDGMDVIYNGGGGENILRADQDGRDNTGAGDHADHKEMDSAGAAIARPAEMIILVPPVVFDGRVTPLMPAVNRGLAAQMSGDGVGGLDIDVYIRDHFIPLPNTINSAIGRCVISLRVEEALCIDTKGMVELSRKPRCDDSYAAGRRVPEAAEWFAETLQEEEKRAKRQLQLRQRLLENGWFVPFCVRRLEWADLSQDQVLEACRIIARFYPFVRAGEDELWYHIRRLDQRHSIGDHAKLRNIVHWGVENPAFAGCDHSLLHRFCPAGQCFWTELVDECENPFLFA